MQFEIKTEGKFKYLEQGEGDILLLLHGLFGALSNFSDVINQFSKNYKVVVPLLPLFELPVRQTNIPNLVIHIDEFISYKAYEQVIPIGNSLGGHVGLMYALQKPQKVKAMVLTGSSGLYENSLGDTFPKRSNYEYIKNKTEYTFYDPAIATKTLVDEVFRIVNDRNKVLRVIQLARSAIKNNLSDEIPSIHAPTLLIWGKEDKITPAFVAEEFHKLIPNTELCFMERCGHAPMMEHPIIFNQRLEAFLEQL
ncbi:MAG: alpha/beta fold hydrolase [Chitinophagales bacterium]